MTAVLHIVEQFVAPSLVRGTEFEERAVFRVFKGRGPWARILIDDEVVLATQVFQVGTESVALLKLRAAEHQRITFATIGRTAGQLLLEVETRVGSQEATERRRVVVKARMANDEVALLRGMAGHGTKPVFRLRTAGDVRQEKPFCRRRFLAHGDGQFFAAHIAGRVGNIGGVEVRIGGILLEYVVGAGLAPPEYHDDAKWGGVVLLQQQGEVLV